MKRLITIFFLLTAGMLFAQQNTVTYVFKIEIPLIGGGTITSTIDEGTFLEGVDYILPEAELTGFFANYNFYYDGLEGSVFKLDDGAIDEDIWVEFVLGGFDPNNFLPGPQFGFPLFFNLNIDVRTHPDSPAVAGDYNFNDDKYLSYSIPKTPEFLAVLNTLNFDPNNLAFRFILASGYLGIGIQTINGPDTLQFRTEHLSRFGGGRGNLPTTSLEQQQLSPIPADFSLAQNYPNPFNPSTKIRFSIPESSDISLKVYDMLGAEVATLAEGYQEAGTFEVTFEAGNLPAGVYFYRLNAAGSVTVKKMLLVK